jgi:hypothetical protein
MTKNMNEKEKSIIDEVLEKGQIDIEFLSSFLEEIIEKQKEESKISLSDVLAYFKKCRDFKKKASTIKDNNNTIDKILQLIEQLDVDNNGTINVEICQKIHSMTNSIRKNSQDIDSCPEEYAIELEELKIAKKNLSLKNKIGKKISHVLFINEILKIIYDIAIFSTSFLIPYIIEESIKCYLHLHILDNIFIKLAISLFCFWILKKLTFRKLNKYRIRRLYKMGKNISKV